MADRPDEATPQDWHRLNQRLIQEAERRIAELRNTIEDVSVRAPLCSLPLSPAEVRARHRLAS